MAYVVTTVREFDDQQPPSGWVVNSMVYDPFCRNEEEIERFRQEQVEEFGEWETLGSLPTDQSHIHLILKMMWDLEFLKPPEDPLQMTPQGWQWHRERNFGA